MKFITRVLHRNVYHEILNSYSQNRTGAETQTQQLDYFFHFMYQDRVFRLLLSDSN